MLEIISLVVSPFMQNARILAASNGDALLIDPGGDADRIMNELKKRKLTLKEIWLTHSHLDHCGAVKPIKEKTGALLKGHPIEKVMRENVTKIANMYGIPEGYFENCPEPDEYISGGEVLEFCGNKFKVLFTPGHSPGHICFYNEKDAYIISGDTIFEGSIGRSDLPGGDHDTLIKSIREQLLVLPDETKVLSGHGGDTEIGEQKNYNPFLHQ